MTRTVPLMLLAAVATHFTARRSAASAPDGPAGAIMRWSPWVFPLGAIAGGLLFPFSIGVLLYWLTSNAWTLGQQSLGQRWIERAAPPAPVEAAPVVSTAPRTGAVAARRRRRGRSRTGRRKVRR